MNLFKKRKPPQETSCGAVVGGRHLDVRKILDSCSDLVMIVDAEGKILEANQAACAFFGLPREKVVNSTCFKLMHNSDKPIPECPLTRSLASKKREQADLYLEKRKQWFNIIADPIFDPEGKLFSYTHTVRDITERVRIEQELKESRTLYSSFLKNFPGIAYRGKMDFTPVFFHGRVREITGYSEQDFTSGKTRWDAIIVPEDKEKLRESSDKIRSTPGFSCEREYRIIRKDKTLAWLREHIQNICDEHGRPAFVEGTLFDISEMKLTEHKLIENETRYRTLIDHINTGVAVYRAVDNGDDFEFVSFNRAGEKIDSLTKDRVIGSRVTEVFPGIREFGLLDVFKRVWTTGVPEEHSATLYRDSRISGWRNNYVYKLPSGELVAIYEDITQQKMSEDELKASERRLADVIDFLPDATFVVDKQGRVTAWNRAIEEMTGVPAKDMLGKGEHEYAVPFYGERRPILIDLVLSPDPLVEHKYSELTKSNRGTLFAEAFVPGVLGGKGAYLSGVASPLYDSQGAVVGAIESIRDISTMRKTQEALKQDEERLKLQVSKFSALYDVALRMSAEKSFEQNISSIAHEAKELLGVDSVQLALCNEDYTVLRMHAVVGARSEALRNVVFPYGEGLGGKVMKCKRGLVVSDYLSDPAITPMVDDAIRQEGFVSLMAVPVQSKEKSFGVMYASNRKATEFNQEDIDTLQLLANLAAVEIMRKQALQALEESEERFRAITESAQDSIFIKDRKFQYVQVNPAMERLLGKTAKDIMGKTDEELFNAEIGAHSRTVDVRVFNGSVISEELSMPVQSRVTTFSAVKVPLRNAAGDIIGLCGIARDITDRKIAMEMVADSERYFRALIDNAQDSVGIVNEDGTLRYVSSSFERMVGFSPGEVVGRKIGDLVCPEDAHRVTELFQNSSQIPASTMIVEYRMRHKDGTKRYLEIVARNMLDDPVISGVVLNTRDITERKKAEDKLQQAYRQLKETQEELLQSSKLAAMGQLAAGISHELNQPLTGIKGFAQAALYDLKEDDPLCRDLKKIIEQSERMDKIINNIRLFARKSDFVPKDIDVNRPIELAFELMRDQLKNLTITVEKSLGRGLPLIQADGNQLQQVMVNLLSNAKDAIEGTAEGSPRKISVSSAYVPQDKSMKIKLSDSGIGIKPENISHIFDPFFSTKEPGKGMGLGLSIIYRIIESLNGKIDVESELGTGTTVTISLPVQKPT